MSENRDVIRQKFEACLIDGLKGQPLTSKDGPVYDKDNELLLVAPEASFLSVVRAYLKDLEPAGDGKKVPQTGKATGMLAEFERKMPFGARAN